MKENVLSHQERLETLLNSMISNMILHRSGECSFTVSRTHKLAQDKPTLTCQIPIELLGFNNTTVVASDYCLRAFAPYIDALNSELYNRSRPDNENGRYYLYRPGGEVLVRNTAYFALCPQKNYENGKDNIIYLRARLGCAFVSACRYNCQKIGCANQSRCFAMTCRMP